jgi:hypothetical protein
MLKDVVNTHREKVLDSRMRNHKNRISGKGKQIAFDKVFTHAPPMIVRFQ